MPGPFRRKRAAGGSIRPPLGDCCLAMLRPHPGAQRRNSGPQGSLQHAKGTPSRHAPAQARRPPPAARRHSSALWLPLEQRAAALIWRCAQLREKGRVHASGRRCRRGSRHHRGGVQGHQPAQQPSFGTTCRAAKSRAHRLRSLFAGPIAGPPPGAHGRRGVTPTTPQSCTRCTAVPLRGPAPQPRAAELPGTRHRVPPNSAPRHRPGARPPSPVCPSPARARPSLRAAAPR